MKTFKVDPNFLFILPGNSRFELLGNDQFEFKNYAKIVYFHDEYRFV